MPTHIHIVHTNYIYIYIYIPINISYSFSISYQAQNRKMNNVHCSGYESSEFSTHSQLV